MNNIEEKVLEMLIEDHLEELGEIHNDILNCETQNETPNRNEIIGAMAHFIETRIEVEMDFESDEISKFGSDLIDIMMREIDYKTIAQHVLDKFEAYRD